MTENKKGGYGLIEQRNRGFFRTDSEPSGGSYPLWKV